MALNVKDPSTLEYFKLLENSLLEESQNPQVLTEILKEIYEALHSEDYPKALNQLNELEEVMDREFC